MPTSPRIYLDNAATTWPKPEAVYAAVDRYQRELGAPAGRSAYREATEVERLVAEARTRVAKMLGASDPRRIIFTSNGTDSLNLALHGLLRTGDHVITTVCEHNSVLRPLRQLEDKGGVEVTRVPCDRLGVVAPEDIARACRRNTRLIALVQASNVTGALQPVEAVGAIAAEREVLFLVDAAQSLGHLPLAVEQLGVHLLAAPGHKGLLGPLGTGVLYVAPGVERQLAATRQGGTGTQSESDRQPQTLPDKYEAGNLNVPGIVGLSAGMGFLSERGLAPMRAHERALTAQLLAGLASMPRVRVHGPADAARQLGVVSISITGYDPQEVAATLDAAYAIQVRGGMHCAPLMHESLGTAKLGGTVRFSVGAFNTPEQIEQALHAIAEISSVAV